MTEGTTAPPLNRPHITYYVLRVTCFGLLLLLGVFMVFAAGRLAGRHELAMGERGERLYLVGGFDGLEGGENGPYRWTHPTAAITVPHAGPGALLVNLRVFDAAPAPRPLEVTLDGTSIYSGTTQVGGVPWTLQMPAAASTENPTIIINTEPWNPPGDSRTLGVALMGMEVEARDAATRAMLAAGALSLSVLVLALAVARRTGRHVAPFVAGMGVLGLLGGMLAYGDVWLNRAAPAILLMSLPAAAIIFILKPRSPIARRAPLWGAVLVAALLLLITLGRFNTGDAEAMHGVTLGIMRDGVPWQHYNKLWGHFGLGQSLVTIPLQWLGEAWAATTGGDAEKLGRFCVALLNQLVTPATALVLFLGARRRFGGGAALALAGTFLLATPAIPYARMAFAEPLSGLLIFGATMLLWTTRDEEPALSLPKGRRTKDEGRRPAPEGRKSVAPGREPGVRRTPRLPAPEGRKKGGVVTPQVKYVSSGLTFLRPSGATPGEGAAYPRLTPWGYTLTPLRGWPSSCFAGLLLGLAVLVKPANGIYLPLAALYLAWSLARDEEAAESVWWRALRQAPVLKRVVAGLAVFGVGVLPGLLLTGWFNYIRYNSPFITGYENEGFTTPLHVGLYGLLFSPGKGIIYFAPPVLLAAFGLAAMWRSRLPQLRAEALVIAAQTAIVFTFHALWSSWDGNVAWGPRFLIPFIPFMLWPLGALARVAWARVAWGVLGVAGFLVAVAGTLVEQFYYFDVNSVYREGTQAEWHMRFTPEWSQIVAHWRFILTGEREPTLRPTLESMGLAPWWDTVVPLVLVAVALLALVMCHRTHRPANEFAGNEYKVRLRGLR